MHSISLKRILLKKYKVLSVAVFGSFLFFNSFLISAQMISSKVVASCVNIRTSGKRHQSYFFTFKIEKVLEGSYNDSLFFSHELYHGLGGQQVISKIKLDSIPRENSLRNGSSLIGSDIKIDCSTPVILKLIKNKDKWYSILWISEIEREQDLEDLEKTIFSLKDAIENKNYELIKSMVSNKDHFTKDKYRTLLKRNKNDSFSNTILYTLRFEYEGETYVWIDDYKPFFEFKQNIETKKWKLMSVYK